MELKREEIMKLPQGEAIDLLLGVIGELMAVVAAQGAKIAELEARVNQNSQNSSKPPSGDIYKRAKSARGTSGKGAGGQEGHEGHGHKIMQEPDEIKKHMATGCEGCERYGACIEEARAGETRYEIEIEVKPKVTAHRAMGVICPKTGGEKIGEFPPEIKGTIQYGLNIETLAVTLNTMGMVSIKRTHEILKNVFGVPISTGTISTMVERCAEAVREPVEAIKEALREEEVVHYDETGTRVEERNHWAHVASTAQLTYISVEEKRGQVGMESSGVLPNYNGVGIHDCWEPYFKYDEMEHGLCGAHLLRELTAVTENTGQEWAQKLSDLLLDMKKVKEDLISQGNEQAPEYVWERYELAYDEIVNEALAANPLPEKDPGKRGRAKRGKVRALVDRLANRKFNWLLFFIDFIVPFTNNQAESDIRVFKVKQKVSGCFRSKSGADNFAAILSFISTARKNGFSAFSAIKDAFLGSPFSLSHTSTE